MRCGHTIAALNCGITFAFPYSTGGRDYAIMDNISTIDVLSMIGNASTAKDQVGQRTPEPTGPLVPYSNGGLGMEYPIKMDSTLQEEVDGVDPESTGPLVPYNNGELGIEYPMKMDSMPQE